MALNRKCAGLSDDGLAGWERTRLRNRASFSAMVEAVGIMLYRDPDSLPSWVGDLAAEVDEQRHNR